MWALNIVKTMYKTIYILSAQEDTTNPTIKEHLISSLMYVKEITQNGIYLGTNEEKDHYENNEAIISFKKPTSAYVIIRNNKEFNYYAYANIATIEIIQNEVKIYYENFNKMDVFKNVTLLNLNGLS